MHDLHKVSHMPKSEYATALLACTTASAMLYATTSCAELWLTRRAISATVPLERISPNLINPQISYTSRTTLSTGTKRAFKSKRQAKRVAFASISMSSPAIGTESQAADATRAMPLFMIASAAEVKTVSTAPTWRITLANLLAGATAGCAVEAALYPIDTIKTRLQAMIGGGGWKALMASGGSKGLYAGVWGNLAGVAPSSALFMAVYEPVKQAVYKRWVASWVKQHKLRDLLFCRALSDPASVISTNERLSVLKR
eukprot:jgi/Chrzof1/2308/Cz11g10140.t1